MIEKSIRKNFLKKKMLLLAILALLTIAFSLLSISLLTYKNLETSQETFKTESNTEDFRIYTLPQFLKNYDKDWENKISKDFGVKLEPKEYYSLKENDRTYNINKYDESATEINKIKLVEGKLPLNKNEIILTPKTMEYYNYKVGDKFKIDKKEYKISGVGYFPEYTFPTDIANGDVGLGDNSFIPVYMNGESYDKLNLSLVTLYYSGKFNEGIPDNPTKVEKKMMEKYYFNIPQLNEYGQPQISPTGQVLTRKVDSIAYVMDQKINPAFSALDNQIAGQKTMFRMLSIVIIIITILLIIVLLNNIFKEQKREIGILKAEGVETKEIAINFIKILGMIILISDIIGLIIGYFASQSMQVFIISFYSLPILIQSQNLIFSTTLILLALSAIIILIVYFISIRRNLKTNTLKLIKNIEQDKPPRFKFRFLTNKLNFKNKYKVNILLRNLPTTFLLIFGVLVSSFMLLLGTMMFHSTYKMLNSTYTDIYTYDYEVQYSPQYKAPFDENSIIKKNTEVKKTTGQTEVQSNSTITLYGFDTENNQYINLRDKKGNEIPQEDYNTGLVISSVIALYYQVGIGDKITITNPYDEEQEITFKITNIADEGSTINAYSNINYLQKELDVDSDYANGEVGAGDQKDEILKEDKNATYKSTVEEKDSLANSAHVMYVMIGIIMLISSFISFIALVVISTIVINHNRKTISVMKVLGYTDTEIVQMTTSTYKWIVIIVYFASIPLMQYMIQQIVNQALKDMDFALTIRINLLWSMIGFVIIFVVYLLAMLLARRSINKIQLAESLKIDE